MTSSSWQPLTLAPTELAPTRLELHWAAQLPAALGIARAVPREDFAQHALTWDGQSEALVSALVPARRPHRAGLRLADTTLLLLAANGETLATLALSGRSVREGLQWLDDASRRLTPERAQELSLPDHELPAHALASGARFGASVRAHAAELARWYANLDSILRALARGQEATPARVWSHHFDLDTVLARADGSTLGLGYSPGDESFAEPYLYVLPNPYPDEHTLPALPAPMEWITDGWVGAVLRGSHVAARAPAAQAELVHAFYASALACLRESGRGSGSAAT